jgi:hypothetical protein
VSDDEEDTCSPEGWGKKPPTDALSTDGSPTTISPTDGPPDDISPTDEEDDETPGEEIAADGTPKSDGVVLVLTDKEFCEAAEVSGKRRE